MKRFVLLLALTFVACKGGTVEEPATARLKLVRQGADRVAVELENAPASVRAVQVVLKVDGGAAANNLLMQFQCDVLGTPIRRPQMLETTALGAAFLAGLGAGELDSTSELGARWQLDRRFEPRMAGDRREALLHERELPFGRPDDMQERMARSKA